MGLGWSRFLWPWNARRPSTSRCRLGTDVLEHTICLLRHASAYTPTCDEPADLQRRSSPVRHHTAALEARCTARGQYSTIGASVPLVDFRLIVAWNGPRTSHRGAARHSFDRGVADHTIIRNKAMLRELKIMAASLGLKTGLTIGQSADLCSVKKLVRRLHPVTSYRRILVTDGVRRQRFELAI